VGGKTDSECDIVGGLPDEPRIFADDMPVPDAANPNMS
jgi:hypothetical protein